MLYRAKNPCTHLSSLFSNAYCYVLPSDVEGMPLSLLEAMSYGNCCLTSSIPECTEILGKRGRVFEKGDVADLKRKLEELLADGQAVEALRSTTCEYVCGKYDWQRIAEETLALYRGKDGRP